VAWKQFTTDAQLSGETLSVSHAAEMARPVSASIRAMKIWIALPAAAVALAAGGIFAVDRRFRIPQVPHRRDPGDFGIPFTAIRFPTVRGRSLYGWWIPAAGGDVNAPAIVLVHGWSRNVERVLPFIRRLHPAGFNLLAFDARSHGSSDKDGIANMLKFSEDVRAAVTEAVRRGAAPGRIGVLGLSVGGAAAIHAAAHDPRIGAVLTIGAFAHPGDLMCEDMRRKGFPGLAIAAILRYVEHNVGARLDVIAPEANVGRITPPLLLVHGEEDAIVPVTHGHRLAAAAPPGARTLFLAGRGHSDCDRDPAFWPAALDLFAAALGHFMPQSSPTVQCARDQTAKAQRTQG